MICFLNCCAHRYRHHAIERHRRVSSRFHLRRFCSKIGCWESFLQWGLLCYQPFRSSACCFRQFCIQSFIFMVIYNFLNKIPENSSQQALRFTSVTLSIMLEHCPRIWSVNIKSEISIPHSFSNSDSAPCKVRSFSGIENRKIILPCPFEVSRIWVKYKRAILKDNGHSHQTGYQCLTFPLSTFQNRWQRFLRISQKVFKK